MRARRARRRLRKQLGLMQWIVFALFVVAALAVIGEIPREYFPVALEWGVALLSALVLTWIVGHVLAFLTGDLLEKRLRIRKVSIPLFPLIAFAVKWWLFGL